ncbi:hypothetical protein KIN20_032718 [Parelaphostrongylus tenuis]|uniref:Small integral membrane protein 15 n=1 Tax=Parelaphostrongylus tenuis TaxID=148309 RepID=A0AAD5WIA7_PARTN|nr:hypothetical protein KIN20_032718 [Parelaphostrongylus tenuis]
MHWLKEYAIRLVAIIVHEPMLFVQYVLVVIFAFVVLVSVMHWKVQKSVKKQEKMRKQKEKILRKLHDSRRRARDDSESVLVTEKDKNE